MNCCNTYGTCTQGPNCPARTDKASTVPPEAGNFRIIDLGPDDDDSQPLNHDEAMRLVRTPLVWLLAVTALALAVSYTTERWADVLWAYLAQLS